MSTTGSPDALPEDPAAERGDPAAGLWQGQLHPFAALPSTNSWMREHLASLSHGDVVWCISQTAGHGRFNRDWHSHGDRGLTFSVRIDVEKATTTEAQALTPASAIAVARCLRGLGLTAQVKWPNDVWVEGRKICGILAERVGSSGPVILGIGLNVNMTQDDWAQASYATPPTSMHIETGRTFDVPEVLRALLDELTRTFEEAGRMASLLPHWRAMDALVGQRVRLRGLDATQEGRYLGMREDGAAQIENSAGAITCFHAGDMSLASGQLSDNAGANRATQ